MKTIEKAMKLLTVDLGKILLLMTLLLNVVKAQSAPPVSLTDILHVLDATELLKAGIYDLDQFFKKKNQILIGDVRRRGINFQPTPESDKNLRGIGVSEALIKLMHQKAPNAQADAHDRAGGAFYDKKDYLNAAAEYSKAIALHPNLASAYLMRGNSYSNAKDYGRAVKDFTKCISLYPNFAAGYESRGRAYQQQKFYKQAIADYTKALSLPGGDASLYKFRAEAYEALEENDLAAADRVKTEKRKP